MRAAGRLVLDPESEDLTTDKTDDKDAVLVARLTGQLRCYLPEPVDEEHATLTRLRHLGSRREELLEQHVASVQTVRDLIECVWPAALETAKHPFRSATWVAALTVVVRRDAGDLHRTRRVRLARFERAVRAEVTRGRRPPVPADRPPPLYGPDRHRGRGRAPARRCSNGSSGPSPTGTPPEASSPTSRRG